MSDLPFDPSAPKRPTNLSVNSDLLRRAKELKINLSQALEDKLAEKLREEQRRQWKAANKAAFAEYNEFVAEHGAFGDEHRRF